MRLSHLWLTDFRNHPSAELSLPEGLTVVVGPNGEGKTNLLEAIGYLTTLSSFRGAPPEALVRRGADRAILRAQGERAGRDLLEEVELPLVGRPRVSLNRQPVRRPADLHEALVATVFSPDDLSIVKEGPAQRRRYLDDLLGGLHARHDSLRRDLERVVRQRTALLRDAGGRLSPSIAPTLEVWDLKLTEVGEAVASARAEVVDRLLPLLSTAYNHLASGQSVGTTTAAVGAVYESPWREIGLAAALAAARQEELRRCVCLVGPHRDDLELTIDGMPTRTHASQGEQRSLALALRLAGHQLLTQTMGDAPLLLLDDVFSELDPDRAQALVAHLPPGQAVLTTTGAIPAETRPELVMRLSGGRLAAA